MRRGGEGRGRGVRRVGWDPVSIAHMSAARLRWERLDPRRVGASHVRFVPRLHVANVLRTPPLRRTCAAYPACNPYADASCDATSSESVVLIYVTRHHNLPLDTITRTRAPVITL